MCKRAVTSRFTESVEEPKSDCVPKDEWIKNCSPCFREKNDSHINKMCKKPGYNKQLMSCDCKNSIMIVTSLPEDIEFKPTVDTAQATVKPTFGTFTNRATSEVDTDVTFTVEQLESDDFRCKPGSTFKLECNTCWCAKNGKEPKSCTRIACNPKVYALLGDQ